MSVQLCGPRSDVVLGLKLDTWCGRCDREWVDLWDGACETWATWDTPGDRAQASPAALHPLSAFQDILSAACAAGEIFWKTEDEIFNGIKVASSFFPLCPHKKHFLLLHFLAKYIGLVSQHVAWCQCWLGYFWPARSLRLQKYLRFSGSGNFLSLGSGSFGQLQVSSAVSRGQWRSHPCRGG